MLYLNIYTENTYFNLDQVLHSRMHWIGNPVQSELVLEETPHTEYRQEGHTAPIGPIQWKPVERKLPQAGNTLLVTAEDLIFKTKTTN